MSKITINNACSGCAFYLGAKSCLAYPREQGIPDKIWNGEHDHRNPYPGDNGIQFEPLEPDTRNAVRRAFGAFGDNLKVRLKHDND